MSPAGFGRRRLLQVGAAAIAGTSASGLATAAVKHWDQEFDVIVVGFGVAGACASYEALRDGAKVLVLDRGSAAAGESHGTYIYMGGGTALQRAYKVEDTPEEMMKYLLASNGPDPDKGKIQVYVERSIENYDWLVKIGTPFSSDPLPGSPVDPSAGSLDYSGSERAYPYRDIARPAPRGHSPHVPIEGNSGGGAWLQKHLLELTRQAGARQLLSASARQLVRGDDGVVQGLTAEVDGKMRSFRATRGVILATGGFALNQEMVAQQAPDYLKCSPVDVSGNDGWGIRAGQTIGAAVKQMGAVSVTWTLYPPLSRKQGVMINGQGQRFVAEDSYFGRVADAIVREQEGIAYLFLDAAARGNTPTMMPETIVAQAATLPELERLLGIPEPALQQTFETYNRYAAKGEDPLFHKGRDYVRPLKPPFTVVNASIGHAFLGYFTLGGLVTNPKGEVLAIDGATIPGLYAVGRATAGIPCPYYYASGLSLGEGVTFGRIAGRNAARRD